MRVIVKFTVKFPPCSKPKTHAYGVFDCEFDFDSHEWSCSQNANSPNKILRERVELQRRIVVERVDVRDMVC